ncbi:MAG: alpha-glucan family phosphorylase [Nanoarchaeota archaeon]|nr:alpha-glucan family phosphorylase [Nanoarchaeota archaeon]
MSQIKVAYFSAEIGIDEKIKTYSGGLGILAGDTIKAMADKKVPFCAVTLLYRHGFFKQKIGINNLQEEFDDDWDYENILEDTKKEIIINILGEDVVIKIWKYEYVGVSGHKIPIYFLDSNLGKNKDWMKDLTKALYVGDRIAQEMILGIGGVRALKELGIYDTIQKFHMNEGHSAFLTLELYKILGTENGFDDGQVQEKCIFTTHTPIAAGHDKFEYNDIYDHFRGETDMLPWHLKKIAGDDKLNMTLLALNLSCFHNAVSKKHGEVSKGMFPQFTIDYITNGIHTRSWLDPYLTQIYDKYMSGWREDFTLLKNVFKVPNTEIYIAHGKAKKDLIEFVNKKNITGAKLKEDVLTIGFARRFIGYKDAELIFKNIDNLKKLGTKVQFIFAGKSHAHDGIGKDIMRRIISHAKELKESVSIAFIEDYNISVAKKLVSGCDLWLNTPIPFNEASGTSGMKAAANACIHFSRLDGWAIESFEMNGGGFPIHEYCDFIQTLEYKIIPMFYSKNKTSWVEEMKLSIANSGGFFNTHRMVDEYLKKGYKLK